MQRPEHTRHQRFKCRGNKKVRGSATDGDRVDWSIIFDIVASEYGYCWKDFTALTYKQLDTFLEVIAQRRHNDIVVQASLHGIKLESYRKKQTISKKVLTKARKMTQQLLAEKING